MFTILWISHTHSKKSVSKVKTVDTSTQYYKDKQVENKDDDNLWW